MTVAVNFEIRLQVNGAMTGRWASRDHVRSSR